MALSFPYTASLAADDHVDIWLGYYGELVDEQRLSRLREVLSHDERQQEKRYHFADDRKRYLITRALVRTVLAKYAEVSPNEWVFSFNEYGRPAIAEQHGMAAKLSFNLSHTRQLIALAVTWDRPIGIDVENLVARPVSLDIANHCFSPSEFLDLTRVPHQRQQERFFEYWVCKEAYVKARGLGLSLPLNKFSFTFAPGRISVSMHPELDDAAERWAFLQYRPSPEHLLALCCERKGSTSPTVSVRKAMPLEKEEMVDLPLVRTSEPATATLG